MRVHGTGCSCDSMTLTNWQIDIMLNECFWPLNVYIFLSNVFIRLQFTVHSILYVLLTKHHLLVLYQTISCWSVQNNFNIYELWIIVSRVVSLSTKLELPLNGISFIEQSFWMKEWWHWCVNVMLGEGIIWCLRFIIIQSSSHFHTTSYVTTVEHILVHTIQDFQVLQ